MADLRNATEIDYNDSDILPGGEATAGTGLFKATLSNLKKYMNNLLAGASTAGYVWTLGADGETPGWAAPTGGGGGTGLPNGGTKGQVLTKIDATNGNADWETPASAAGTYDVAMPTFQPFAPTFGSSGGGVPANVTTNIAEYLHIGELVVVNFQVTINDIGPASGFLTFSLPTGSVALAVGNGRENAVVGKGVEVFANNGNATLIFIDSAPTCVNGYNIAGTFSYIADKAVPVGSVTIPAGSGGGSVSDASLPHKYWRLRFGGDAVGNYAFSMAELQFRSVAGGPTVTTGGAGFTSSDDGTNHVANLFDGDLTNCWSSVTFGSQFAPANTQYVIGYAFANAVNVAEFAIIAKNASQADADQCPEIVHLEYSDDGKSYFSSGTYSTYPDHYAVGEQRIFKNNA